MSSAGGLVLLSIWPLAEGETKAAIGCILVGLIGIGIGYGIWRLEQPPKPPVR